VWNRRQILSGAIVVGLLALALGGAVLAWQHLKAAGEPGGAALHWRQAHEALRAQDFANAREHLEYCVQNWPAHAQTHFLLARTSRRADDLEYAARHLKIAEALQWYPEEIALERLLARAQAGDLRETESVLLQRLEENSGADELIYEALIKGNLVVFQLPQAMSLATRWLEEHPDRWQPWLYRGRAHYLNNTLGRAIADYRRALQALPHLRQGRLWYASALVLDGRFRDALPAFEQYVADYPDDSAGLLGIAYCHQMLKQSREAEAWLGQLLRQHPKHAAGLLLRARLELDRDAPQQAVVWLKQAEAAAPNDVEIAQAFITAYRQLGKTAEVQHYEQRVEELRKLIKRLDAVRTEIMRSPREVGPRHEAGVLCLRLGQPKQASDWLVGALALDANHRPTHEALAECFERLGDKNLAEYHRRRAQMIR
jgi:tetratricopeptide (TPR) repeat protein